ncbi:MAG: tRNA lysidine(34) synthetase TilS [Rudaea sp.]|uniref:tRNA lysidine(34) synthetase TilS n=1 Tax=unclassified Rudaea TaxID=2627037 RepID=UPI0010FA01A6|nr:MULTISPECIES: tRNA lysidine(34) synthetase TilS [unclassified Rudaea]MBN8888302.1 tRNA lysidine(34) synthetase TilS [Rudaea sp.]
MPRAVADQLNLALAALPPGALVVGYSGGADSSVLLHALAHNPIALARGLRAVHVDHALHADSAVWSEHCRKFATGLGVPIEVVRVEVARDRGTGLEDAARTARRDAFERVLARGEILALAHHRDDQAETVLLKLLRGAGPEGLGGMRALRKFGAGLLWRPLLELPRAAVLDYARAHDIDGLDDPSNADTALRRNFLRREILPRLRARWPDADVALAHSAGWARNAADFVDAEARKALARLQGLDPATLVYRDWLNLHDALRDPVLRLWLRGLGLDEPAHFHVAELERQLRDAEPDRLPCVRFSATELRRYRDLVYALRTPTPLTDAWQADWDGQAKLALPGGGTLELARPRQVSPALTVRYRRGGERIRPAGMAHTRELRLLLQEAGVPPWLRERIPLICRGDKLIAVADLFRSDAAVDLDLRFCFRSEDVT